VFDDRLVRLTIEIEGNKAKVYTDLYISANGTKFANGLQNEITVKIQNISKADQDYILTETSPYNFNRVRKRIILEAGRESYGYMEIFQGDIIRSSASQPPDIEVEIKAKTSNFSKGNIVSNALAAIAPLKDAARLVAKDLELGLQFEATEKNIANYNFVGSALNQVDIIDEVGGVNCYVDNQTLVVKDKGKVLKNPIKKVSQSTGMVGVPVPDVQGITVKTLLDNHMVTGAGIQIESETYPDSDGVYEIFKLDFELSNWDTAWYWVAQCKRLGRDN